MKNYWLLKRESKESNFGFPPDDEFTLHQRSSGTANLDMFYAHNFMQGEIVFPIKSFDDPDGKIVSFESFDHKAMYITGTIYYDDVAVQEFVINDSEEAEFKTMSDDLALDGFQYTGLNELMFLFKANIDVDKLKIVCDYEFPIDS